MLAVAEVSGPDAEGTLAEGSDIPGAVQASAVQGAFIMDVVRAGVSFDPARGPGRRVIRAVDHKRPDAIRAVSGDGSVVELEAKFHWMLFWELGVGIEAGPEAGGEQEVMHITVVTRRNGAGNLLKKPTSSAVNVAAGLRLD